MVRLMCYLGILLTLFPLAAEPTEDADQSKIRASCPKASAWQDEHPKMNSPGLTAPAKASNPRLRSQLLNRERSDQQARQSLLFETRQPSDAAIARLRQVDQRNLNFLQRLFREDDDVPTVMSVGADGMDAFWLLVQHADLDSFLQSRVLAVLKQRHDRIPLDELALLEDRVRVNRKRPQLYGTQFTIKFEGSEPDHQRQELEMQPVEDEERVDERRAAMNLMPLEDYQCVLRAVYGFH